MSGMKMTEKIEHIEDSEKKISWGKIVFLLIFLPLVFGFLRVVGAALGSEGPVKVGVTAPDFELVTFEGEVINSEDLLGKVVFVNFWASWCLACKQEAVALQDAWEMYEPRGDVIFLGVAYADADKVAKEYIAEYQITYANGHDLGTKISRAFNPRMLVPETFIIDQEGYIAYTEIGPFPSLGSIISAIEPLLEE
jgi:cytochrome c biogenesis protein CcmG/thiol:disulfide interchange protein DsbE